VEFIDNIHPGANGLQRL